MKSNIAAIVAANKNTTMSDTHFPVLVLGAGIAGLAAAQRLVANGIPVLVLDKGRGVGGRMATRRSGAATFDHGAQYFSAKTIDFQNFVREASAAGAVREWRPDIPDKVHPRWVGAAGISAVPKFMAEKLTVQTGKKAVQILALPKGWQVVTDDGVRYTADALIVTIPAPQALELLANSPVDLPDTALEPLRHIAYYPCLAVLATLDRPSGIPAPGGLLTGGEPISWVADNFQKGISGAPSMTIHGSPEFSHRHLDGDLQQAGRLLLEAAASWIRPAQVVEWQIHRWRYSLAWQRHPEPFWQAAGPHPLLFGGDGFGVGNVEGAYLSGLAMAIQVMSRLSFSLENFSEYDAVKSLPLYAVSNLTRN